MSGLDHMHGTGPCPSCPTGRTWPGMAVCHECREAVITRTRLTAFELYVETLSRRERKAEAKAVSTGKKLRSARAKPQDAGAFFRVFRTTP